VKNVWLVIQVAFIESIDAIKRNLLLTFLNDIIGPCTQTFIRLQIKNNERQ